MIESDGAKYLVALAVTIVTVVSVLLSGARRMPGSPSVTAIPASQPRGAEPDAVEPGASAVPAGDRRPRIFTGEPANPEPHRPAARRAARLVGGVTVLAAAGAIALIAFARALILLFSRIGD